MLQDPFPSDKAAWLAQVAKELKGRPLDELRWQLGEGIVADPFTGADDLPAGAQVPLLPPPGWVINEDVVVSTDLAVANVQILEALQFGAESITLEWQQSPGQAALATVLEAVYIDYIGVHFSGTSVRENPGTVLAAYNAVAQERGISPANLQCSLAYAPANEASLQDWRYLADLLRMFEELMPNCRLVAIKPSVGDGSVLAPLTDFLRQADQYLRELEKKGLHPAATARFLQVEMHIGTSYFVEIARLRALHLLWLHLLKAWQIPAFSLPLSVRFDPACYTDALYTNMIRATTMAMSGVLGGATRLSVLPYDTGREEIATYPRTFARRIARNVQHLLKMESGLDQIQDPAAGSYYIETLTKQLAETAWAEFGKQHTL